MDIKVHPYITLAVWTTSIALIVFLSLMAITAVCYDWTYCAEKVFIP